MEEAEMSKDEKELNGKSGAKKYLEGNLQKPMSGYSGKRAPNGSLINGERLDYGEVAEDTSKKKVVKEFPFIKEGDQSEYPSNTGSTDSGDDLDD